MISTMRQLPTKGHRCKIKGNCTLNAHTRVSNNKNHEILNDTKEKKQHTTKNKKKTESKKCYTEKHQQYTCNINCKCQFHRAE